MSSQKSRKGSPSRQEPTNIHPYPDWQAMQAYYGHGVPVPPPYLSSPMMAGHPPHQMWGPAQGVMPPYGVPYQTVYPPGVVYAHPATPVAAPAGTQQPSKIPENRGLSKKVKKLETISAPVSNGAEVDDEDSSWSQDQGFDAACDFSDARAKVSFNSMRDKGDDRQLKREKRKQANRESARKSRMRKQAEVEELMERYENLKTENSNLNFEINHLAEESEKLRAENAAMMEKLGGGFEPSICQSNHTRDESIALNSDSFSGDESENEAL